MQAGGQALFSRYRFTGLAVAIALAVGMLIAGQLSVTGALSSATPSRHEPAGSSTQSAVPLFIVSDADGVFHQQQDAAATSHCAERNLPVFIAGDTDGLANPAVNALIPTARCNNAQH